MRFRRKGVISLIKILDNGIRIITLGEGTTYIGQCINKKTNESDGILFSNTAILPKNKIDELSGEEVAIEITNFQGAMSYIKAITDLLITWKIDGLKEKLEDLNNILENFTKK